MNEKQVEKSYEIKMVSVAKLREHELQTELSPSMSDKSWKQFVEGIRDNGILQPLIATKDGRVIDGKNRLRAAKELGISGVRVVYEEIPENDIAEYITRTKLDRDDLSKGQRACIILNRHDVEFRANQGTRTDLSPNGEKLNTHQRLAKTCGIGGGSMSRLIEVKRKRPDLFAKVFEGSYSIGKAHAELKADEQPKEDKQEFAETKRLSEIKKAIQETEQSAPQFRDTEPAYSPNNTIIQTRQVIRDAGLNISHNFEVLEKADEEVKSSYLSQITSMVKAGLITLGKYTDGDENSEMIALCLELVKKIEGGV